MNIHLFPNRTIVIGESFKLRCSVDIDGYMMVWKWKRGDQWLKENGALDLSFEFANETHEGRYTCIVRSGSCEAQSNITVIVEGL